MKDFEVSRYLAKRNLGWTQEPLVREMLISESIPWEELKLDEIAYALALASQRKPIFFSMPLIGPEEVALRFSEVPADFLRWVIETAQRLGQDTFSNVRYAAFFILISLFHVIQAV